MSPKKCAGNRMAQRPTCQPLRGSTSLDYTHVRFWAFVRAGPAPVRSHAWRLIRRLPHDLPRGPRRRPFLPATPASSPSPLLSFCSSLRSPHPPSLCLCGLVSWPCVYNNSHHFGSLLIAPSLFLPSILRVDPVAAGPVPLEENHLVRRKGLERKVGHGRSSSSSSSSCYVQMLACYVWFVVSLTTFHVWPGVVLLFVSTG